MKAPLTKLVELAQGREVICSDDDLAAMTTYDISNCIRSKPNPTQCGIKDRWICWIEYRDLKRFETLPFEPSNT